MKYNFSTLNDKDLEELARDLLSKKFQLHFQSFKSGRDKGIDLRYSTINDEKYVSKAQKNFVIKTEASKIAPIGSIVTKLLFNITVI